MGDSVTSPTGQRFPLTSAAAEIVAEMHKKKGTTPPPRTHAQLPQHPSQTITPRAAHFCSLPPNPEVQMLTAAGEICKKEKTCGRQRCDKTKSQTKKLPSSERQCGREQTSERGSLDSTFYWPLQGTLILFAYLIKRIIDSQNSVLFSTNECT